MCRDKGFATDSVHIHVLVRVQVRVQDLPIEQERQRVDPTIPCPCMRTAFIKVQRDRADDETPFGVLQRQIHREVVHVHRLIVRPVIWVDIAVRIIIDCGILPREGGRQLRIEGVREFHLPRGRV